MKLTQSFINDGIRGDGTITCVYHSEKKLRKNCALFKLGKRLAVMVTEVNIIYTERQKYAKLKESFCLCGTI